MMLSRTDEYARHDPHATRDLYVLSHRNMQAVEPKPEDEPYQDWIEAGHAARRQHALHTYRAFAPILPEYEDMIDHGRCLNEFLARRFDVSENVIKWLRYRSDRYAEFMVDNLSADQFAILCRWLDRVEKSARPTLPNRLKWFILANRFLEWRTGVFCIKAPTGISGRDDPDLWERICRNIGNAMHGTRDMEHRLLAHTVFRWRSTFGLEVLRAMSPDLSVVSRHDVKLALSPTWDDIRRTGFSLIDTNAWLKNLPANTRIDDPDYWTSKLTAEEEARRLAEERHASSIASPCRRRPWWASRIRVEPPHPLPAPRTPPCRDALERAQLILNWEYDPGVLPPLAPRDTYPRRRRSAFDRE
jgi:hypothetical protein